MSNNLGGSLAAVALSLALLLPGACTGRTQGVRPCEVCRPPLAKRTFDDRVGTVLVLNGDTRPAEVRVYHPDGLGNVELRWKVGAGQVLPLTGPDGERLALGNDWGIQVAGSCVRTLGETAEWRQGEFSLTWRGDTLRPGLDTKLTR